MKNILITVGGIAFIGVCSAFSRLWSGMLYFSLVGLICLTIYWAVILIFRYKFQFYDDFENKFKIYVAKLINSSTLTSLDIETNRSAYVKKFKKTLIYDKIKLIAFIAVLICVAVISFSLMVSGKI